MGPSWAVMPLPAGLGPLDGIAMGRELLPQEGRDALLVLDDPDLHRGILLQKVAPRPGRFTTPDSPSWARAIPRTIDSPRPVRPVRGDAMRNGSKTNCSSPGGTPPPTSATSNRQLPGSARTRNQTGPLPCAGPAALRSRFSRAWVTRLRAVRNVRPLGR